MSLKARSRLIALFNQKIAKQKHTSAASKHDTSCWYSPSKNTYSFPPEMPMRLQKLQQCFPRWELQSLGQEWNGSLKLSEKPIKKDLTCCFLRSNPLRMSDWNLFLHLCWKLRLLRQTEWRREKEKKNGKGCRCSRPFGQASQHPSAIPQTARPFTCTATYAAVAASRRLANMASSQSIRPEHVKTVGELGLLTKSGQRNKRSNHGLSLAWTLIVYLVYCMSSKWYLSPATSSYLVVLCFSLPLQFTGELWCFHGPWKVLEFLTLKFCLANRNPRGWRNRMEVVQPILSTSGLAVKQEMMLDFLFGHPHPTFHNQLGNLFIQRLTILVWFNNWILPVYSQSA